MKLLGILLYIGIATAVTVDVNDPAVANRLSVPAPPSTGNEAERDFTPAAWTELDDRAGKPRPLANAQRRRRWWCRPSTCQCIFGAADAGLFCGDSTINKACRTGYLYQCHPDGNTCQYGPGRRGSCVPCNLLQCPATTTATWFTIDPIPGPTFKPGPIIPIPTMRPDYAQPNASPDGSGGREGGDEVWPVDEVTPDNAAGPGDGASVPAPEM